MIKSSPVVQKNLAQSLLIRSRFVFIIVAFLCLSNTLATWCEALIHWKRPWCWGRLKAGGEGDDRRWDGWMASPTQWTWIWVSSRSWRWTGTPDVLQSMGSQRLRHDWVTELNWTELCISPTGPLRIRILFYFRLIFSTFDIKLSTQ